MRTKTKRSRAYPLLTLEQSRLAVGEIRATIGAGGFSREVLAEALGHGSAYGGPGARKIAALTQFGLLRRKAGLYSPTALAERIALAPETLEGRAALREALQQPPLFRALLERYAAQGRIPAQLAPVLWREHGITRKASELAAENFKQSARFAGALDESGVLLAFEQSPQPAESRAAKSPMGSREAARAREPAGAREPAESRESVGGPADMQRFVFPLTAGQVARFTLPRRLRRADLEIIKQQVRLIAYQVTEEVADHA